MPGCNLEDAPLARLLTKLSVVAAVSVASAAHAQAPELTVVEAIDVPEEAPTRPWLGVMIDAGVPDGANLNLAWRPDYWLRFHGGPSYNGVGFGLRGGVSLLPFDFWISPSVVLEGGYFFPGDLAGFVETVVGGSSEGVPDQVRYAYANLHLGLELGTPDFGFFLRGGYSMIDAHLTPPPGDPNGVRFEGDTHVTAFVPTAKLGFVIYLL